ncbi:MAG: phospho-sugar mutase [Endomicrobium sp.]|nr:phospho-sugar mutase [Endomicrobium sp.]
MNNYIDRYNYWCCASLFKESVREELKKIRNNIKEIEDRFCCDIKFGTGGIRGLMGAGTNRINEYTILRATQGIAHYIISQNSKKKSVVIAYDTRLNSKYYAELTTLCLNKNGIKTYLFKDSSPTPELSYTIRKLGCIAGIVITASHNTFEYNGYKVYWSDGGQITDLMAERLFKEIQKVDYFDVDYQHSQLFENDLNCFIGEDIDQSYIDTIINLSLMQETDSFDGVSIVYTPLHGTGARLIKNIADRLDIKKFYMVNEQIENNGYFSTVNSPNPDNKEVFNMALNLAKNKDADIIIATDPDADRLGVMAKKESDEYKFFTGNMLGVFLLNYILEQKQKMNILPPNGVVLKTIVSSKMIEEIAKNYGLEVIEVLTGFKYIGEQIEILHLNKKEFVFGLEESNGYLAGIYARDKDAISAAMILCEACAFYKSKGISVWDKMLDLYKKYGFYKEDIINVNLSNINEINNVIHSLRSLSHDIILKSNVIKINDYISSKSYDIINNTVENIKLPKSNVLLYEMNNSNWFAVRSSGTEIKLKIYFGVKDRHIKNANSKYKCIKTLIYDLINLACKNVERREKQF